MRRASLLLTLLVIAAAAPLAAEQPQRPSILFIFSDDHALQAITAYGNSRDAERFQTPNLDRLASQGAFFVNSFCHFWLTRSKVEVDFVLYGESGLYAVEVKNSAKVLPGDLRSLRSFGEDYPEGRRFLPIAARNAICGMGFTACLSRNSSSHSDRGRRSHPETVCATALQQHPQVRGGRAAARGRWVGFPACHRFPCPIVQPVS
jgi:hypothetical protein